MTAMEVCKMNFETPMLLECKVCTSVEVIARGKEYISSWSWLFHMMGLGHLEFLCISHPFGAKMLESSERK